MRRNLWVRVAVPQMAPRVVLVPAQLESRPGSDSKMTHGALIGGHFTVRNLTSAPLIGSLYEAAG
jgi:hypothetical protein